jgi:hypothetical protein
MSVCRMFIAGVLAAVVMAMSSPWAGAAGIPVVNPSFEDPALDDDSWAWNDVPGRALVNFDSDALRRSRTGGYWSDLMRNAI